MRARSTPAFLAVSTAVLVLAACGGNGDGPAAAGSTGGSPSSPAAPVGASISGTSFKGPTAGATVCLYAIDNTATDKKGAKVAVQAGSTPTPSDGCVVTANDGTYSVVLPAAATGDLLVESTGGTYCSDETVFDGTACAGGGTPIAMGVGRLRTVVAAPAAGAVTSAPLTLLTTAAASAAGNLSLAAFDAAYAGIAANFGVAGTTARTAPDQGVLKTALQALAGFLGGDTGPLAQVVASIADGTITAPGGQPTTGYDLECRALAAGEEVQDVSGLTFCTNNPGGGSSRTFYSFPLSQLFGDSGPVTGSYGVLTYEQPCNAQSGIPDIRSAPMAVSNDGELQLPVSLAADGISTQMGVVNRLRFTIEPSDSLPRPEPLVLKHLFCKTQPAGEGQSFKGYLTSDQGPRKDGFFTRIDPSRLWAGLLIVPSND